MDITFSRKKDIIAKVIEGGYKCELVFIDEFHDFFVEVYTDMELKITQSKITMNKFPYDECKGMYSIVEKIKDIKVEKGYTKTIAAVAGGRNGCTHLVDLFVELGRGLVQIKLKYLAETGREKEWLDFLRGSCMSY